MRCSCVIVNYTEPVRSANLARMLASYDEVERVFIVDNCSPDDSWERLQELKDVPGIILIKSDRNGGYGYGNNLAFRACLENPLPYERQLLMICNPDTTITASAVAETIECFAQHPNALAAAPVEYDTEGNRYGSTAWEVPSATCYIIQFLAVLGRIKRVRDYRPEELSNRFSRADCLSGALLMVDAEHFNEIGLYDEGVFLFCEETGMGVRSKGIFETYVCTRERYTHEFSTSMVTSFPNFRKRTGILSRSRRHVLLHDYKVTGFKKAMTHLCYGISLLEAWPLAWAYNALCLYRAHKQRKA